MTKINPIKNIKEAEKKAMEIIEGEKERSKEEKNKAFADIDIDGKNKIEAEKIKAENSLEELLENSEAEINEAKKRADDEAFKLKNSSEENKKKAVNFVVKALISGE